jgi:hypothetical protein
VERHIWRNGRLRMEQIRGMALGEQNLELEMFWTELTYHRTKMYIKDTALDTCISYLMYEHYCYEQTSR